MKNKPALTSGIQENIKVTALKKTIVDFVRWAIVVVVFAVVIALVCGVFEGALYIYLKYGMVVAAGVVVGAIFVGFFLFRYFINLNTLKEKTTKGEPLVSWLTIDKMNSTPPVGRYNLILKNGKILWNVTELVFFEKRDDVSEWMLKPNMK